MFWFFFVFFGDVLGCLGVLGYFLRFWDGLEMFWRFFGLFLVMFRDVLGCLGVLGYFLRFWDVLGCFGDFLDYFW